MRPRDPLRAGFGPRRKPTPFRIDQVFAGLSDGDRQVMVSALFLEMIRETIGSRLDSLPMVEAGRMDARALRGFMTMADGMRSGSMQQKYRHRFQHVPAWLNHLPPPISWRCMEQAMALNLALPVRVVDLLDLRRP